MQGELEKSALVVMTGQVVNGVAFEGR
jgi:hypothetical protein